ncbi:single-stranded DNA-binding protein [Sphingomonas melonis]|uniref:Single-stranded DNA-binding protein n=1 Tax=Sphingomonas melonis TaxID=152682 RepID=A0A7Y9K1V9_9SPHN|nr:single-stranded DNA-binding protein [Sphingomonas melonis]NYD88790.1 single-strand DNA-binding protein [Sphingomonas melonis]
MQFITITGNVGKEPEQRTTQGGDVVTSFSVAVRQGFKQDAPTVWFRCSVWAKRGDTIKQHLAKGAKATVIGELTIGEYQGKPQYDLRVADVDWSKAAGGDQRRQEPQGGGGTQGGGFGDDLEDDVPFVTGSFLAGLRVS